VTSSWFLIPQLYGVILAAAIKKCGYTFSFPSCHHICNLRYYILLLSDLSIHLFLTCIYFYLISSVILC